MPGGLTTSAAGRAYWGRGSTTDIDGGQSSYHCPYQNPVLHDQSKHIDIKYHFLRDCVYGGQIILEFIETVRQLADILAKPLERLQFLELRSKIGMVNLKLKE